MPLLQYAEEIKIRNEQIHTLTEIISAIDGLIDDAGQDVQQIQSEMFDLTKMIRKIAAGLHFFRTHSIYHILVNKP